MEYSNNKNEIKKPPVHKRVWEWWIPVAHKIGNFNARVILTIFYFTLFVPFALVVRFATDPLRIKPKTKKGWIERIEEIVDNPIERARKQF